MKIDDYTHTPVLLEEVLDGLAIRSDGFYVDATFGRGGHSLAILQRLNQQGRLLVFDKDPDSVKIAKRFASEDDRFGFVHAPFSDIQEHIVKEGKLGAVNGILFDLGMSSPQLDKPERGFSFSRDGDLDMRMNPDTGTSASDWINAAKENEIVRVLRDYGEERFARRIAKKIVEYRTEKQINRTAQLAELIVSAVPFREKEKHPATRSFQAIRIFINDELGELRQALKQVNSILTPGGRLAVISFHSLEDRIVKRYMREESLGDDYPQDLPVTASQLHPRMKIIGKAIKPGAKEIENNPRARSAVLRFAEKLAA
ncbi:MAG: 16S rRNA (cytosine1402-N4)-methyltransferase [Gammaproteobacteria bacterium]|jgi:16S rRNA (cytosine1402-N4)-methyltransferase